MSRFEKRRFVNEINSYSGGNRTQTLLYSFQLKAELTLVIQGSNWRGILEDCYDLSNN